MKKFSIALLMIPMLLTGCGQTKQPVKDLHSGPNRPSWVSYYRLGKPTEYYVISPAQKVTNVSHPLWNFSWSSSQGSSGWETNNKNAVQVFSILRANTSKAVAVKLKNGTFVKANAVGTQKP